MTTRAPSAGGAVPPWTLAVGAMLSVQLGSAADEHREQPLPVTAFEPT